MNENLDHLMVEARIQDLLLSYRDYAPRPLNLLTETGTAPYPPANDFSAGAYFQLQVEIHRNGKSALGELRTPSHPEDENIVTRMAREQSVFAEFQHPKDSSLRNDELLRYFQFPQRIDDRLITTQHGQIPISILMDFVESAPLVDTTTALGKSHLVREGVLTKDDVIHMAQFIKQIQRIGDNDRFAYNPLYLHRFMSYGPHDGNYEADGKPLFKWTRDLEDRNKVYETLMGDEFARGLKNLVHPDDLNVLFTGKRVLQHGNFLFVNWGIVSPGIFRSKSMERTCSAQTLESDNATVLRGLVADEARFGDFFIESLRLNPTHMNLEHRRRGFLLDRFIDANAMSTLIRNGADDLKKPLKFYMEQAFDALHSINLWDPSKYTFLTDDPLRLRY